MENASTNASTNQTPQRRKDDVKATPLRRWEDKHPALAYLLARLQEPSTWRGAVWLVTATGICVVPTDQIEHLVVLGMTIAGVIGVICNEHK